MRRVLGGKERLQPLGWPTANQRHYLLGPPWDLQERDGDWSSGPGAVSCRPPPVALCGLWPSASGHSPLLSCEDRRACPWPTWASHHQASQSQRCGPEMSKAHKKASLHFKVEGKKST